MAARFKTRNMLAAHLEREPRVFTRIPSDGKYAPAHTRVTAVTWCGQTLNIVSTTPNPEATKCEACAFAYTEATGHPAGHPAGFLVKADEVVA